MQHDAAADVHGARGGAARDRPAHATRRSPLAPVASAPIVESVLLQAAHLQAAPRAAAAPEATHVPVGALSRDVAGLAAHEYVTLHVRRGDFARNMTGVLGAAQRVRWQAWCNTSVARVSEYVRCSWLGTSAVSKRLGVPLGEVQTRRVVSEGSIRNEPLGGGAPGA